MKASSFGWPPPRPPCWEGGHTANRQTISWWRCRAELAREGHACLLSLTSPLLKRKEREDLVTLLPCSSHCTRTQKGNTLAACTFSGSPPPPLFPSLIFWEAPKDKKTWLSSYALHFGWCLFLCFCVWVGLERGTYSLPSSLPPYPLPELKRTSTWRGSDILGLGTLFTRHGSGTAALLPAPPTSTSMCMESWESLHPKAQDSHAS